MSLRKALIVIVTVLASTFGAAAWAQSPYSLVNPPQPTESNGKVEVIEFFWYGCPHCYHLEPTISAWLQHLPKDVTFKRVPAVPSESWGQLARVFYTFQAMGLLPQYHEKIFDAIHKDNLNLGVKKIRDPWLQKNGIDPKKYDDVEKSFTVMTDLNRARQMTINYKIDSVPTFIVNGKYRTSAELAGGTGKIFEVIDQLIAKSRQESGAAGATAAHKK